LGGVDEAEQFVEFKGLGSLREKGFELDCCFGIVAGFILSDSGLEFLVEGWR
jgi:hypothetical protein